MRVCCEVEVVEVEVVLLGLPRGLSFLPDPLVPHCVRSLGSSKSGLADPALRNPIGGKPAAAGEGQASLLGVDCEFDSDSDVDSDVDSDADFAFDFDFDFAFDLAFDFYRRRESPLCRRSISPFSHRGWPPS